MPQILRRYQKEAVETVLWSIDPFGGGLDTLLYTLPTGAGKTTVAAEIILQLVQRNHKILFLAHRGELIEQACKRIVDHCKGTLKEWEVGYEANIWKASPDCKVIVGMVQTCCRPGRPNSEWKPTVILTDECAHAAAKMQYGSIYDRYGVGKGKCFHIGMTATAKRLDRLSLYAKNVDGSPVMIKGKKGKPDVEAVPENSVYEQLVYDYTILDAVEDGWIVEPCGYRVQTQTDLSAIKIVAGDFNQKQLEETVNEDPRTLQAISRWKEIAADRPTLAFCVGVEHSKRAAELWRDAGYTAQHIDGETDSNERRQYFEDFKAGKIQVITNVDVATEGTDLPNCSCVVCLRPTKSWSKYIQQIGRGARPLDGILNGMEEATPEERKAKIAASGKNNNLILDVVDICDQFDDLCTAPNILDLPCNLDLEGHSVTDAKRMIDAHKEAEEIVVDSIPATFTELQGRLIAVDMLRKTDAKSKKEWKIINGGQLSFAGVALGYNVKMTQTEDRWRLDVIQTKTGELLLSKTGKPVSAMFGGNEERALSAYLDKGAQRAQESIDAHRAAIPAQSRGTLQRLTGKQINVLLRNGHSRQEIDCMPYQKARAVIEKSMKAYRERMEGGIL